MISNNDKTDDYINYGNDTSTNNNIQHNSNDKMKKMSFFLLSP